MSPLSMIAILLASFCSVVAAHKRPIQIFLLAGQSNMVGMGSIDHLKELIQNDTSTANEYRVTLWDEDTASFKIRDDVLIKYGDNYGNLTVGQGFAGRNSFGPELMFGWVLGDAATNHPGCTTTGSSSQPILLIKTAYGGRNLAIDFRPPASGEGKFKKVKPIHYGWQYRIMITEILDALQNLGHYVPNYNGTVGYQLAGLVWFQGWNDMLSGPFVAEYGRNLVNLIRDVRLDLDAPDLPFIVGELGMHGVHPRGRGASRVTLMRAQEKAVTLTSEFRNASLFVRTAPYVVENGTAYNGGYHYNGRADTFFHIGQAFGRGMLKLWDAGTGKASAKL